MMSTHHPRSTSRRRFIQVGALGTMLGLPDLLWARSPARPADLPRGPEKSCIFVFLHGGPAHLDLFDMKPEAPEEIRGPYKPIATPVPGLRLGELLPRLARPRHAALPGAPRRREDLVEERLGAGGLGIGCGCHVSAGLQCPPARILLHRAARQVDALAPQRPPGGAAFACSATRAWRRESRYWRRSETSAASRKPAKLGIPRASFPPSRTIAGSAS